MKHQYALKIESPCSENWNEMLSSDKGRFCLHCQKTVMDFSEMTDYEIAMYLHQHKNENLCGKFMLFFTFGTRRIIHRTSLFSRKQNDKRESKHI